MEFEVKGRQYRNARLPAREASYLLKALGPFLVELLAAVEAIRRKASPEAWIKPFFVELARMPRADYDEVYNLVFESTQQLTDKGIWARLKPVGGLMQAEVSVLEQFWIIFRVTQDNLGDFSDVAALLGSATPAEASATPDSPGSQEAKNG